MDEHEEADAIMDIVLDTSLLTAALLERELPAYLRKTVLDLHERSSAWVAVHWLH